MLGTGNALATRYYNTCFLLQSDTTLLMVDAGGGNQIFRQLESVGVSPTDIHHLFLTHAHTDHVLGAVWLVRMIMQKIKGGQYDGDLHIYGNSKVTSVLEWICRNTLPAKLSSLIGDRIIIHVLNDGDSFMIGDWQLNTFDIRSTKEPQYGFRITFTNGTTLTCLGDEPFNETNRQWVEGVDWLLCEAFCLHADANRFHPYEKNHSTAIDGARLANELHVKNLVLYHTEDKTSRRKDKYTHEAQSAFSGNVYVPDDLETIVIDQEGD